MHHLMVSLLIFSAITVDVAADTPPATSRLHTAKPADSAYSLTLPEVFLDPNAADWTGRDIQVAVSATGDSICSVDLAFVVDAMSFLPDTPFVAMHAFEGFPGAALDWNAAGDTIFISVASNTPVTLVNEPVVELSFMIGPYGVPYGCIPIEVPLMWLPGVENTNIDEQAPTLTDGRIFVMTVGIEEGHPARFALAQNAPNPFNSVTTIAFSLPEAGRATLGIYSTTGQLVRTLVDGEVAAGTHAVVWDGRDDAGRAAASGVYIVRLAAGAHTVHRRATLLR